MTSYFQIRNDFCWFLMEIEINFIRWPKRILLYRIYKRGNSKDRHKKDGQFNDFANPISSSKNHKKEYYVQEIRFGFDSLSSPRAQHFGNLILHNWDLFFWETVYRIWNRNWSDYSFPESFLTCLVSIHK